MSDQGPELAIQEGGRRNIRKGATSRGDEALAGQEQDDPRRVFGQGLPARLGVLERDVGAAPGRRLSRERDSLFVELELLLAELPEQRRDATRAPSDSG